jgi:hypothetical protein
MRRPFAALLFLSCTCLPDVIPEGDGLPAVNVAVLGSDVLTDVSNGKLEIDPTVRDALTGLGGCADLISYCYAPPAADVTYCMKLARTCETDTPWTEKYACCPQACKDAYTTAVTGGAAQRDALEKTLFIAPDCFPGVNALLSTP